MPHQYVVYIVEDDAGVRQSLTRLMTAEGYTCHCFATGREFLDFEQVARYGCLVLDMKLPDMSGLDVQEELAKKGVDIPVIVITGHGEVSTAVRAMKSGAVDFLQKPFEIAILLERIRGAFARLEKNWEHQAKRLEVTARMARLSPREREVMNLVVAGMPSKIIAAKLGLSTKTVENHRAHLKAKLHVESIAELVQMSVIERGQTMQDPEPPPASRN